MKLRARVQCRHANAKQSIGTVHQGMPLSTGQFPPAATVEIAEDETGYLLIRYAADGEYAGDSWFASIDEAKRQAEWEFGIDPATGWWDGES